MDAEKIAALSDKELTTLNENATRLAETGSTKQRDQAVALIPIITAELEERASRAPVKKAPARRAATTRTRR